MPTVRCHCDDVDDGDMEMGTARFMSDLEGLQFDNTFNPYRDRCEFHDRADAPAVRRKALHRILDAAAQSDIDSLWIGRDLGYRGGRRTGLAFTDDRYLAAHGERWRMSTPPATIGPEIHERTAAVVWNVLNRICSGIFLWNVFPLHPHLIEQPFTNRAHNAAECEIGIEVLSELVGLLRPGRLVCIGADAAKAASGFSPMLAVHPVRHPSYGGYRQFLSQMMDLYDLEKRTESR